MKSPLSIKSKLFNISKENDISFQQILVRYFHERILYRLSISSFQGKFLLKGGNLIYAFHGIVSRPTTDIDFLGQNISNNENQIIEIFKNIVASDADDGVVFEYENINVSSIAENKKYHGVRLVFNGKLDTVIQKIQIDIGFGDIVTPGPQKINYPIILNEMTVPVIWVYNVETIIAEKFHAIYALGKLNSRMKDIYDIYTLLMDGTFHDENLTAAISNTFKIRETEITSDAAIFSDSYLYDSQKEIQWDAYKKRTKIDLDLDFSQIMKLNIQKISKYINLQ